MRFIGFIANCESISNYPINWNKWTLGPPNFRILLARGPIMIMAIKFMIMVVKNIRAEKNRARKVLFILLSAYPQSYFFAGYPTIKPSILSLNKPSILS